MTKMHAVPYELMDEPYSDGDSVGLYLADEVDEVIARLCDFIKIEWRNNAAFKHQQVIGSNLADSLAAVNSVWDKSDTKARLDTLLAQAKHGKDPAKWPKTFPPELQ